MKKIVITGGPCAGKTSVLDFLGRAHSDQFVIISEAATILLKGGFHLCDFWLEDERRFPN